MRRSLSHFWRQHLAVGAGVAVAAAVLTGALLVGDSVRGSLLDMTRERLGEIDDALVGESFFGDDLARRLADALSAGGSEEASPRTAPLIQLPAGARHGTSRQRASGVNLLGVEARFLELFPPASRPAGWDLASGAGGLTPVILNDALARELGAQVGDAVVFSFPSAADAPRASLLGRRDAGDVLQALRTKVAAVVADEGAAVFSLSPHQGVPWNAFLPLGRMQRALDRENQANVLLVAGVGDRKTFDGALRDSLTVADLGLQLLPAGEELTVESARFVLRDEAVTALAQAAEDLGATSRSYLTYLANEIRVGEAAIPYSSVTALAGGTEDLVLADGEMVPPLEAGDLLLNAWAAEQLGWPKPGAEVEFEYFVVGDREQLRTETARFHLLGTVAMEGLGADPRLTPEFPGIHDADDISDWDPPFPVDLSRVRPVDEEYWDLYRAAPKAFISEEV